MAENCLKKPPVLAFLGLSLWASPACLLLPHSALTEFLLLFPLASFQDDPVTNLNNAFEVAEKYLDIPKMLDAEGKSSLLFSQRRAS